MNIKPLHDRVVIKRVEEETTTASYITNCLTTTLSIWSNPTV